MSLTASTSSPSMNRGHQLDKSHLDTSTPSTETPDPIVSENPSTGIGAAFLPIVRILQKVDHQVQRYCSLFSTSGIHAQARVSSNFQELIPRIAVVGSQSSGKTSLIEGLCGLPSGTLPKGQGIVTRLPLALHIHDVSQNQETPYNLTDDLSNTSYVSFDHRPGQTFSISRVNAEIQERTDQILRAEYPDYPPHHCVSATPIVMHVYSMQPTAELSFVDLPGLTRVPIQGQPSDISSRLRDVSTTYINTPNVVILALTPMNTDLANSEALTLAQSVDPRGTRTIGILTKADLIEEGVDAVPLLEGTLFPLQLGYYAVVSDGDGDPGSLKHGYCGVEKEMRFFYTKAPYCHLHTRIHQRCGLQNMVNYLLYYLCACADQQVPDIKEMVERRICDITPEVDRKKYPITASLGAEATLSVSSLTPILLCLLTSYGRDFTDLIDGRCMNSLTNDRLLNTLSKDLFGGAKIQQIFSNVFRHSLESVDELQGLSNKDISLVIQNASGVKPSLFVPDQAFEALVKRQLRLFERPAIRCVDLVYEELKSLLKVTEGFSPQLELFPTLKAEMREVCHNVLAMALPTTKQVVSQLIEIELAFVHTSHPSFNTTLAMGLSMGSTDGTEDVGVEDSVRGSHQVSGHISMVPKHPVISAFQRRSLDEVNWVKRLLKQYLTIVKMNLVDSVPKAIMRFLVHEAKESLSTSLIQELYQESKVPNLLKITDELKDELAVLEDELAHLEMIRTFIDQLSLALQTRMNGL